MTKVYVIVSKNYNMTYKMKIEKHKNIFNKIPIITCEYL